MAGALRKAHIHFAELTTFDRQMRAEQSKAEFDSRRHEADARRHLLTGRDDLAHNALTLKAESDKIAADFAAQRSRHGAVMTALQGEIESLAQQHRDAVRDRDLFLARKRAEDAQAQVRETVRRGQAADPMGTVRDSERRAEAEAELDGRGASGRPARVVDAETQFARLQSELRPPPVTVPPMPTPWFDNEPAKETVAPTLQPLWFDDEPVQNILPPEPISPWFEEQPAAPPEPTPLWFDDAPMPAPPLPVSHDLPDAATLPLGANRVLPDADTVIVSVGWQSQATNALVACAILTNANGAIRDFGDIVAAPQVRSLDGSVEQNVVPVPHQDNATVFLLDLSTVPDDGTKIVFAVFVDEDATERLPLGQVASAFWGRVYAGNDIVPTATVYVVPTEPVRALLIAEVYRHRGVWKVRALGQGFAGGLEELLEAFGVTEE